MADPTKFDIASFMVGFSLGLAGIGLEGMCKAKEQYDITGLYGTFEPTSAYLELSDTGTFYLNNNQNPLVTYTNGHMTVEG